MYFFVVAHVNIILYFYNSNYFSLCKVIVLVFTTADDCFKS